MINKKILIVISLLLVSFLLAGCFPEPIEENQVPVITTDALPDATVCIAYTATVGATDADGDTLAYEVVGPTDMVISNTGFISGWTPTEAGTEDITVTVTDGITDPVSAPFAITVNEPEPDPVIELIGIKVDPDEMTLFAGESEDIISVTATYEIKGYDIPIALGDCTFVSDEPTVAAVSDVGLVTAVAKGTATITVSFGGKSDSLKVTVNPVLLTSIVVLPETMTLSVRGSETIKSVTAHYNDGSTAVIKLKKCDYEADDEDVATVSNKGLVTAVKVGTATITVTYADKTDTVVVTVSSIRLTSIVVLPETMTLTTDEREPITSVTAHYSDGTEDEVELADCTFETDDKKVATVTKKHKVFAHNFGTATITVSYTEEEQTKTIHVEKSDTIEVTVGPVYNITKDTYYNTIQLAEDEGSYGNTILVAPGTYTENIVIDEAGLNFESSEKHGANIIGSLRIEADGVSVRGFKFTDPILYWAEGHCIFIHEGAEGVLIEGNLIDGFGTVKVNGVMLNTDGNPVLVSADIVDNHIINVHMGIYAQGTTNLIATGNTIEDIAHCGIGIDTSAGTLITGNTISNCADQGIEVFGEDVVANFNNIAGNPNFGVESFGPQVDATDNWWGDASGPTHPNNPDGTGDKVSDKVTYAPFSTVEN